MADSFTHREDSASTGAVRGTDSRRRRFGPRGLSFLRYHSLAFARRLWMRLAGSLHESASYARASMAMFAVVDLIGQPLYYFVWTDVYPQPYESAWLRGICVLFAIPLLFERQITRGRDLDYWVSAYWLFTLLFQLPFFFVFMTLMNHLSAVWALSTMAALMLLVILVFDWLMTVLLALVGTLLAWAVFALLGGRLSMDSQIPLEVLLFTYAFGLVCGSIFNYKSEIVAREKLGAITDAVGTMAHELRTPLLGIRSGARGLATYLPAIMEGYQLAREHGLDVQPIRRAHFQQMQSVLERIRTESEFTGVALDMLLVNSNRSAIDKTVFEPVEIDDAIDVALARYPFHSGGERDCIHWHRGANFQFLGSELLMVHVFFNLFKNALYYLAREGGGHIDIWTERLPAGVNQVHFRDDGPGIRPEVLPRIFDRFYSGMPRGQGTGIGLAFVRLVIDSFGGHIRCDSVFGQYTEFIMSFPEIEADVRH